MAIPIPAPLDEGISTWRAAESSRRLVLYSLLAALAYPLIAVSGTLPLRLVAAFCCIALAGAVLTQPRLRPYTHVLQIFNVGLALILVCALFVEQRANVMTLGVVMLAIFGSQYAFVRRRDLAAAYLAATVFLLGYAAYRGATDTNTIAMIAMILAAFVVTSVTASLQIGSQMTLVYDRRREQETAHLDALSGLFNRTLFVRRVESALASAKRRHHDVAVICAELEGFDDVRNRHGQKVADELIAQAGTRLNELVRSDELAARIGDGAFALLLPNVVRVDEPAMAVLRLNRIFQQPFEIDGRVLDVRASIGVARTPFDGADCERMLITAEAATRVPEEDVLREA